MNKNNKLLQGAGNNLPPGFYNLVLDRIKDGDKILNLGCGLNFNFERMIKKERKVSFTSVDFLPIKKPFFVDQFIIQNVEKPFSLDKKFDVVTFFELIEHIDKTDILLKNCFNNLKNEGYLIFSFPNLSSIYSRIELSLGYQPHILEVSNEYGNFGTGIFGKINNPQDEPIHHLRGITHRAMKELVQFYGFEIKKIIGYEYRLGKIPSFLSLLASVNIFICKKL